MNKFKVIKYILLFTFILLGIMVNANLNIKYETDVIPIVEQVHVSESYPKQENCKKCEETVKTKIKGSKYEPIPINKLDFDIRNNQYSRFYWANNN